VQSLLHRQRLVENLVHRQEEGDERADLVESVLQRKHDVELQEMLKGLHPADVAFILESLPRDERQHVWRLVRGEDDGDVLLEVSDGVRESLIEVMEPADLVAATQNLDTDELAEYTLVFPGSADIRRGRLSVLAPIGTALLGCQEFDTIEWKVPVGVKRFRIDRILYQPEAAEAYHL